MAWPFVTPTSEPKFVPSTRNCTVPPLSNVPELAATVAVKVTAWPKAVGFGEELTAVVVPALLTTCPPLSVPLLSAKLLSPL